MEMAKTKLFEAATKGCITSLQQLLIDDPSILDNVSTMCPNSDTPLHEAARLGHVDFVKKLISIKPQLAKELNSQRKSPLHLASSEGHIEVVKALLSVDREMCLVRDINELTPIHLAVIEGGDDEVVKVLLRAEPDAARLSSVGSNTILHSCILHHRLEAMKLIVQAIGDPEFVNSKEVGGNTVLHFAVYNKQVETIKFLLTMARPILEVNAQNLDGLTPMNIVYKSKNKVQDLEIRKSLRSVGGVRAWDKKYGDWLAKNKGLLKILSPMFLAIVSFIIANGFITFNVIEYPLYAWAWFKFVVYIVRLFMRKIVGFENSGVV